MNDKDERKPVGDIVLGKSSLCVCTTEGCDFSHIRLPEFDCSTNTCPICGAKLKRGE